LAQAVWLKEGCCSLLMDHRPPHSNQAGNPHDDEEAIEVSLGFGTVLVFLALLYYFGCFKRVNRYCGCCCRRCYACCGCCSPCRRCCASQPDVGELVQIKLNGKTVLASHLRPRKELGTAYGLWFFLGFFGAHHFYLDRLSHGTVSVWTLNLLGMGWICDGFLLPFYCRSCNGHTSPEASSDRTCGRAFTRLPLASITAIASLLAMFAFGPRTLHSLHVVDLDQKLAGTSRNPYDILGVARNAPLNASWAAYEEEIKRLRKLRSCDDVCRRKKDDLKQIRGFLSGDFWRRPTDQDHWDEWSSLKSEEWSILGGWVWELISGKPMEKPAPRPASSPSPSKARKQRNRRGSEL